MNDKVLAPQVGGQLLGDQRFWRDIDHHVFPVHQHAVGTHLVHELQQIRRLTEENVDPRGFFGGLQNVVGPGVPAALRVLVLITAVVLVSESVCGKVWLSYSYHISVPSTDYVEESLDSE